jgi:ribosomal-protein-alanine N-acetyltransferase
MNSIAFETFSALTTGHLTLQRLTRDDANGIFALRSNADVIRYTGIKQYKKIKEAYDYIERINQALAKKESIMWSVRLSPGKTFIGSICFWNITQDQTCAEIGYDLLPCYQGKGYMQEAVKAVIECGFDQMKLDKIVAYLQTENIKSVKLLERQDFIREKTEDFVTDEGKIIEMALYVLNKAD